MIEFSDLQLQTTQLTELPPLTSYLPNSSDLQDETGLSGTASLVTVTLILPFIFITMAS